MSQQSVRKFSHTGIETIDFFSIYKSGLSRAYVQRAKLLSEIEVRRWHQWNSIAPIFLTAAIFIHIPSVGRLSSAIYYCDHGLRFSLSHNMRCKFARRLTFGTSRLIGGESISCLCRETIRRQWFGEVLSGFSRVRWKISTIKSYRDKARQSINAVHKWERIVRRIVLIVTFDTFGKKDKGNKHGN